MSAYENAVQSLINGGYPDRQAREILSFVCGEAQNEGHRRGTATARAELEAEFVAWLVKRAREHRAQGPQYAKQADVIGRLADKVSRGAVRPNNLLSLPPQGGPEDVPALRAEMAALRIDRDVCRDWADTLAYKVAPVEVLGRHGEEGKYPWGDALELLTPAAEVDALEARHAAVLSLHRKHSDSEHCFADDETWPCSTLTALGRTDAEPPSPWERAVAGLNALVDAGVAFWIEPDGHISGPLSNEHIEWDHDAARWRLVHDDEEDSAHPPHPAPCRHPASPDCTCPAPGGAS